jgi:AAA15 family ATPase/GTPase
MIESLSVKNFRCYESLEIHGLKRVNVVVGRNASGKTTLLESIFLAAGGSPDIAIRFRLWRGMGQIIQAVAQRTSFESLWKDLFSSLDQTKRISLNIVGSENNTASLDISYSSQTVLSVPLDASIETSQPQLAVYPLDFEWKDHTGKVTKGRIKIGGPRGLEMEAIIDTVPCALFAPGWGLATPQEHAQRFSDLSQINQEGSIIDAVKEEFPIIKTLSIELSGGVGIIHASVDHLPGKVPVGVISNGVMKFVYLLLAITAYRKGVVLVDEIEDGFYYDRLTDIWSNLAKFCTNAECQLFATTHSLECLRAMLPAVEKNQDDFSLIRTTRENGKVGVSVFSGKALLSLIRQGFDPRE